MGNPNAEIRSAPGGLVLTREELATALRVSLRTVDRMVAAEEIPVMELGEDLVRFYLPDVLEALRSGQGKYGRHVEGTTERNIQHSTSNIQHPTGGKPRRGTSGAKCEGRAARAAEGHHESHEPHEREH